MVENEGNQEMDQINIRSIIKESPTPERSGKSKSSPHKRSKKTDDRFCRQASLQIIADEWPVSRFWTHGRKAQAKPRHHQPVPSQYKAW